MTFRNAASDRDFAAFLIYVLDYRSVLPQNIPQIPYYPTIDVWATLHMHISVPASLLSHHSIQQVLIHESNQYFRTVTPYIQNTFE